MLSSGVDTLHLSCKGPVRSALWPLLEAAKREAQEAQEPVMLDMPATGRRFAVRPYGLRVHAYWLSSPDCELIVGTNDRFPPVLVQFHSAFLHAAGVDLALDLVCRVLEDDVFMQPPELNASRIDLYADVQGWPLVLEDLRRFVSLGRARRGFEVPREVFASGHRLTGFRFGRDALMARIYDKTTEIGRRGLAWLPDLWGERQDEQPVWRIEFQFKRAVLVDFGLRTVDEVLAGVQDLWRYATGRWLSYRRATANQLERQWPIDPVWEQVRGIELAPACVGVVRRRLADAEEARLIQGSLGYLTSWSALRGHRELGHALEVIRPALERYMASRGTTFAAEVRRKQARRLEVTDGPAEVAA